MKSVLSIAFCFFAINTMAFPAPCQSSAPLIFSAQNTFCIASGDGISGRRIEQKKNASNQTKKYTKLPDGTVKDELTGLIWEVKENKDGIIDYSNPNDADNYYHYYEPSRSESDKEAPDTKDFIESLTAKTGYHDWRIPTLDELQSLYDSSNSPQGPFINLDYFPNTAFSNYWSSTTNSHYLGKPQWAVNFFRGQSSSLLKFHGAILKVRLRAVRTPK